MEGGLYFEEETPLTMLKMLLIWSHGDASLTVNINDTSTENS